MSQLRNEIARLASELAVEKAKAAGLQETVETLRLKLFSYEGACDVSRNAYKDKKGQNLSKTRPRSEHESRRINTSMSQLINSQEIVRQQQQQQLQLHPLEIQKLSEINLDSHNTNTSFFTNQIHQDAIYSISRSSYANKTNHLLAGVQQESNGLQDNHKQNQNLQQQQQQPYLNQPLLSVNQGQQQQFLESLESQSQEQYQEYPYQMEAQQYNQERNQQQQQSQFLQQESFMNSKCMDTHSSSHLGIHNDNNNNNRHGQSQKLQQNKQYQQIIPLELQQQQPPYIEQYYCEDQVQVAQNQQSLQQQSVEYDNTYYQQSLQHIQQQQQLQPQYIQQYTQPMPSLALEDTNNISPYCDSTQRIGSIPNSQCNHQQQYQQQHHQLPYQDQQHISTDQLDWVGQSNSMCSQFEQFLPEQQSQQCKPSIVLPPAKHNAHRKPPNIPPLMINPQQANSSITMNRIQQSQQQQQQYQQQYQQSSHRSQLNNETLKTDRISSARQSDSRNKPSMQSVQLPLSHRTNSNNDRNRTNLRMESNDSSSSIMKNKSYRCNSLNLHAGNAHSNFHQITQMNDSSSNIFVDQQGTNTLHSNRRYDNHDSQKSKKGQLDYKTLLQCQHCGECVIPNELIDHMATCNLEAEIKAITTERGIKTQRNEQQQQQQQQQQQLSVDQELWQQQQEVQLTQQSEDFIRQQYNPSATNEFIGDNNSQQHQQSTQFWSVIEQLSAQKQAVECRLKELEEQQQTRRTNSLGITMSTARNRSNQETQSLKQQLHEINNQQLVYSNEIDQKKNKKNSNTQNNNSTDTTIPQSRSANQQRASSLLNQRSNNSSNLSKQLTSTANNISNQLSSTLMSKESLPPRLSITLSKPNQQLHNNHPIQLTSFLKKPTKTSIIP